MHRLQSLFKLNILLYVMILCSAVECRHCEFMPIYITNKSTEPIYVHHVRGYDVDPETYDLAVLFEENSLIKIPIDSTERVYLFSTLDGEVVQSVERFIILKEGTLVDNSSEEIIEKRIYDNWCELVYSEMETINFNWVYTGND